MLSTPHVVANAIRRFAAAVQNDDLHQLRCEVVMFSQLLDEAQVASLLEAPLFEHLTDAEIQRAITWYEQG